VRLFERCSEIELNAQSMEVPDLAAIAGPLAALYWDSLAALDARLAKVNAASAALLED
jgi:hypothetical protein